MGPYDVDVGWSSARSCRRPTSTASTCPSWRASARSTTSWPSHRAAGRFVAERWRVGHVQGEPEAAAVLLLSEIPDRDAWEVAYLGLTPAARAAASAAPCSRTPSPWRGARPPPRAGRRRPQPPGRPPLPHRAASLPFDRPHRPPGHFVLERAEPPTRPSDRGRFKHSGRGRSDRGSFLRRLVGDAG